MNNRELPPVVSILLDEPFPKNPKPAAVKKFFRGLLPELNRQAVWTLEEFSYGDEAPTAGSSFAVAASGTLNPLSGSGICSNPACRVAAADRFARTVGVYADVVTIPDLFSVRLSGEKRLSNEQLLKLASDILVLRRLEPLIRAGVVVFRRPGLAFCSEHYKEFEARADVAVAALLPQVQGELGFRLRNDYLEIKTGKLYDPPISTFAIIPSGLKRRLESGARVEDIGRELFAESLAAILRGALLDLRSASRTKAALFSGSRLDVLCLSALEGISPELGRVEHWEEERSVELPWIEHLSPTEIVQLREEASLALPRLREVMLRVLRPGSTVDPHEAIAALRNEAMEAEAEMDALKPARGSRFRTVAGALGISVAVYGFSAGFVTPGEALTSLTYLLTLLHSSARKEEQDQAKSISRPGYALLRARQIQAHRHDEG